MSPWRVDIGVKQEIYAAIERLVADGMAVMPISSDLEEILRLSIVSWFSAGAGRRDALPSRASRLRLCERPRLLPKPRIARGATAIGADMAARWACSPRYVLWSLRRRSCRIASLRFLIS